MTYNISSIKRVTRKFHVVVVQNNGKEIYKKGVLHVQSCCFFLLIRPVICFLLFYVAVAAWLALHDFIFVLVSLNYGC